MGAAVAGPSGSVRAVRGVQGEEDVGLAAEQTPEVLQELAALRVGLDVFETDGLVGEQRSMNTHEQHNSFASYVM